MKTRKDVIKEVANELSMSQQSVIKIISVIEKVIKHTVVDEKEELKLANFVEIKPIYKEPRKARNPKTNEYIISKPKYVVKAKAIGKWFK